MTDESRKRWARSLGVLSWVGAIALLGTGWFRAHQERLDYERRYIEASDREAAILAMRDSADHGYAILDDQGRVIEWNPALERWTGYLEAEMIGKDILALMAEEHRVPHQRGYASIINDPQAIGKVFSISCELRPRAEDKPPLRVLVIARVVKANVPGSKPYAIALINRERDVLELQREVVRP